MKFSLILPTINREIEVNYFLQSLVKQSYKNFEIIIVDQNYNDKIISLLAKPDFSRLDIKRIMSEQGLSKARNEGLKYVKGNIVAFPDDDCWYPPNLLENICNKFNENKNYDGLSGLCIDENERPIENIKYHNEVQISKSNVWHTAKSITLFLRKYVIENTGRFDEMLGAGSKSGLGSGEETDYILRAIKLGYHIHYDPKIFVGHPRIIKDYSQNSIHKVSKYSKGMGFVLRRHNFTLFTLFWLLFKSIVGIVIGIVQFRLDKSRFHFNSLMGKINGYYYERGS